MSVAAQAETIAARIEAVRARIAAAAERARRDPAAVTLIAVSKTHPASVVVEAVRAGQRDFGENRVQEGVAKAADVRALLPHGPAPAFHLIGHLQTNKVRAALATFALIHSVDSERLLDALAAAATAPVRVLLEVNVAGEASKFGATPAQVTSLVAHARSLANVRLEGLMTVAPLVSDAAAARPVFRQLRTLAERHSLSTLSMGMTGDFEVAVEEGATHVRVGRAIFGERQP